nr:hypothetical protein [Rhodococcus rhodochrous]
MSYGGAPDAGYRFVEQIEILQNATGRNEQRLTIRRQDGPVPCPMEKPQPDLRLELGDRM